MGFGNHANSITVTPRYNEPRYSEDPVITNSIWKPGRITIKYGETNPAITILILTVPMHNLPRYNEYFSCRSQSVKTTWLYKWLISQTRLLLVKIGKLDLQSFVLFRCNCSRVSLKTVLLGVHLIVQFDYPAITNIFGVNQIIRYNGVFAITKTPV